MTDAIERKTGELFGALWHALSDEQYRSSIDLFKKRFEANQFDLEWFQGKTCLDAGCGSGRYGVAMALLGAAKVVGCDVSQSGLQTARERAKEVPNISFQEASVLRLPFADESFDFACCSGVLHHTPDIRRGLAQLVRVLKPGGKIFLLLYGTGGLRWRLVESLRPLAREIGFGQIDKAIESCGLPANNRKHFLDDLFVEIQKFTAFTELTEWMIEERLSGIQQWKQGRFDHESDPESQIEDM